MRKVYDGGTVAVGGISFSLERGEIFGFLGLNGAGKTTTIKMLSTLIPPTTGRFTVLGFDGSREGLEIRKRIGVVQQRESYDRNLTVMRSIRLYSSLWGVPKGEASNKIALLLKRFGLWDERNRGIRRLTIGQRRRLQVAREFVHDPELLFLDEPTTGLDVLARRAFLDYCKGLAKDGRTIFYTSHIISELESICDKVAMIHHGKIIAMDSPRELKKKYSSVRRVSLSPSSRSDLEAVGRSIGTLREVQSVEVAENSVEAAVLTDRPLEFVGKLASMLDAQRLRVQSISLSEPSLEDVVVKLLAG